MNIYTVFSICFLVFCLIGIIILILGAKILKPSLVKITHKFKDIPNMANTSKFRLIHISDIHITFLMVNYNRIASEILNYSPDAVLISGDFFNSQREIKKIIKFINAVIPKNTPVYACLGNHDIHAFIDYEAVKIKNISDETQYPLMLNDLINFKKEMHKNGITILDNSNAKLTIKNKLVQIVGIGEMKYGRQDLPTAFQTCDRQIPMVVLAHNPDLIFEISEFANSNGYNNITAVLSGHFHGGQIWLPFNLEYTTMRTEKLCRMGITKGLHNVEGLNLYINRGIGCVLFPFRFLSPPELAKIEIDI